MDLVRRFSGTPLSRLRSVTFSAQPAESARLRSPTLNALNLYQLERWCRCCGVLGERSGAPADATPRLGLRVNMC
jgi:hypothetical protein